MSLQNRLSTPRGGRPLARLALTALVATLTTAPAVGQATAGSIHAIVTDPQGGA